MRRLAAKGDALIRKSKKTKARRMFIDGLRKASWAIFTPVAAMVIDSKITVESAVFAGAWFVALQLLALWLDKGAG